MSNFIFKFPFSCHCDRLIEEHNKPETESESSTSNSGNKNCEGKWSAGYIKKEPTNAYGVIEFHGAERRTRAKVFFLC